MTLLGSVRSLEVACLPGLQYQHDYFHYDEGKKIQAMRKGLYYLFQTYRLPSKK